MRYNVDIGADGKDLVRIEVAGIHPLLVATSSRMPSFIHSLKVA
jgi:hypothetical protein